ncbi:MAG: hypothetical protein ACRDE8_08230 [Ginsengibacter sp.]
MADLNVNELLYGYLDPGVDVTFYFWGDNNSYNKKKNKARFFSITPDPLFPFPQGVVELLPTVLDFQVIRTWTTVWADIDDNRVFQTNVEVQNIGTASGGFHLIEAETDN